MLLAFELLLSLVLLLIRMLMFLVKPLPLEGFLLQVLHAVFQEQCISSSYHALFR